MPDTPKAYYRMSIAYKEQNDFDKAQEMIKTAIKLDPNDRGLRTEYKSLVDLKNKKEKEWYSKMSGFYKNDKL